MKRYQSVLTDNRKDFRIKGLRVTSTLTCGNFYITDLSRYIRILWKLRKVLEASRIFQHFPIMTVFEVIYEKKVRLFLKYTEYAFRTTTCAFKITS